MSMRRPRQELIEQGVLKELPENGRSLRMRSCLLIVFLNAELCLISTYHFEDEKRVRTFAMT